MLCDRDRGFPQCPPSGSPAQTAQFPKPKISKPKIPQIYIYIDYLYLLSLSIIYIYIYIYIYTYIYIYIYI